jgi:serine/threonine protein phosphatase PrpC
MRACSAPTVPRVTTGTVRLLGSDAAVLGEIASAGLGEQAGLALSRGRLPKVYPSVDPNEDAVLAATGHGRWLLAAADGHFGFDAAAAAIEAVERAVEDVLADEGDGRAALTRVLIGCRDAVAAALARAPDARDRSRTALSLGLVRPGELFAATWGDSAVFWVHGPLATSITSPTDFLGPRARIPAVVRLALHPGDAVALATDGFTDFAAPDTIAALHTAVRAATPTKAADALVRAAFAGGAGDNVGVGVLLPTEPPDR